MEKRVFLFNTLSGSEYLVVLTKSRNMDNAFDLLLLIQLVGGDRRGESGLTFRSPEIGRYFEAHFIGGGIRTSMVTQVREI